MSGLEKFQGTNAWFARFKNLLLMERTQTTNNSEDLIRVTNINTSTYDYSLDLSEDFRVVLEEKKIPKQTFAKNTKMQNNLENKENTSYNFLKDGTSTNKLSESPKPFYDKSRKSNFDELSYTDETCDISFEALEKMCNKSASDPDSTLFSYLRTMNEETKESIQDSSSFDFVDTNDELCIKNPVLFNKSIFANQTQLNDVEAPSMIWNNDTTLSSEGLQISPVKMVHMLRPSTIIEEVSVTDSETSHNSFQTARKTIESTSCFDTANETLSSRSNFELNFNNLSYKKGHFFDSIEMASSLSNHTSSSISLETNDNPVDDELFLENSNEKATSSILSAGENLACSFSNENFKNVGTTMHLESLNENGYIIELSDDENSNSQLNAGFSILDEDGKDVENTTNSDEQSLNFNDTIEEMEYIMSKGMQYLNEKGTKSPLLVNSVHLSPIKSVNRNISPSPLLFSPATPNTNHFKKQDNNAGEKASSGTKLDLFKKPSNRNLPIKTLSAGKKKADMKHIISPVGVYIRNTPLTPTFKTIKPTSEVSNSKMIRDLEFDYNKSKQYAPSQVCVNSKKQSTTCSLPRKAYISAEFKHVTDERTPINIPGGEKIHRYLHQTKIPSVIRHDGKLKINVIPESDYNSANKEKNNIDKSLADLSLMSGDVSIYTIKDAQKFSN